MRLTKQTGHAIRILVDCACADGELVKVAEIAERLDITPQNVFKIVHILSHAGFLTAQRGRHGGVKLARPAADIRIGDVVRATEVTSVEIDGQDGTAANLRPGAVPINQVLDNALEAFISVLDQHTLEDMAASSGRRGVPDVANKSSAAKSRPLRSGADTRLRPRVAPER